MTTQNLSRNIADRNRIATLQAALKAAQETIRDYRAGLKPGNYTGSYDVLVVIQHALSI